jgi:hypothetical protein
MTCRLGAIASKATASDVVRLLTFKLPVAHQVNKQILFKISWSACQDSQSNADKFAGGDRGVVGAMSYYISQEQ